MNKQRRKELSDALTLLNEAQDKIEEAESIVDSCYDEECEYRDNIPENLQESDKYYNADAACENLDNANDLLSTIRDYLSDCINSIEAAQA